MDIDDEVHNLIKVWVTAIASLCYCYYLVSHLPKGFLRLLFILPIVSLFTFLPFSLSCVHFGGPTSFFLIWLANFKLLLFSFHLGPLSSDPLPPLLHFISLACLPIKLKHQFLPSPPNHNPSPLKFPYNIPRSILFFVKALFLGLIIFVYRRYDYKNLLGPNLVLCLYCCHLYFGLEIVLAICAVPARALLGLEIEPQFDEPYLAASLQDFWGYRWNLMVSSILRPTVYGPVRSMLERVFGRKSKMAAAPAMVAAFAVSGLMHELMYYQLTRVSPTWEVTWFFVLNGVCTAGEVAVKKAFVGKWRLHRTVSGPLTIGFLAVTAKWLFFPQILRNGVDERAIAEYFVVLDFVRTIAKPVSYLAQ